MVQRWASSAKIRILGYLRLIRLHNCALGALAVLAGALAAGAGLDPKLILGMIAALLIMGFGNALNDYYDLEIDEINHPQRPLVRGDIAPESGLKFGYYLGFAGLVISGLMGSQIAYLIALAGIFAVLAYNVKLKSGISGNLLISALAGALFIYGGILGSGFDLEALAFPGILGCIAFCGNLAREILKDIQDLPGDLGRSRIPQRIGIPNSWLICLGLIWLSCGLMFIPYLMGWAGWIYLGSGLACSGLGWAGILRGDPGFSSKLIKLGMCILISGMLMDFGISWWTD